MAGANQMGNGLQGVFGTGPRTGYSLPGRAIASNWGGGSAIGGAPTPAASNVGAQSMIGASNESRDGPRNESRDGSSNESDTDQGMNLRMDQ